VEPGFRKRSATKQTERFPKSEIRFSKKEARQKTNSWSKFPIPGNDDLLQQTIVRRTG
jgi:hypothetical protein